MDKDIAKILITEEDIQTAVVRLAAEIDRDYQNAHRLVLVGILKGSVNFMADLMKRMKTPLEIDFMRVSSYGAGTVSSGQIKMHLDISVDDIENCEILIVEDIIDSGRTLTYLKEHLEKKGAKSVHTVTLLDKPMRREVPFESDYVGIVIPDEFVVGYGLDFNEKYRELPYIGVLAPAAYKGNE